jgi:hypothetical protein
MFSKLLDKISEFADHHQAIFAFIITFSVICLTWGVEKMLESYLFPQKPIFGYLTAIISGLTLLWLTQHYILHVI